MKSQQIKSHYTQDHHLSWTERRSASERRNLHRISLILEDCRQGAPRRESDISGSVNETDIWWELEYPAA